MSDGFMNIQHLKVSSDWLLFSRIIFCLNMNFEMFYKIPFLLVSFAALVALEWSLPGVRPHVPLQRIHSSASVVALVTFERLLSCVLPHVALQSIRSGASIVALITFERLLSCVLHHHVSFQTARLNAGIIT